MSQLAMQPFFSGEFMRETRGWSILEKGGYRELRDAQWDLGGLPADSEELRRLINASEQEWAAIWKRCEIKFPIGEDGLRRNLRLEEHRAEALEKKHNAITKAKNAAAARWGGDASSNRSSNASSMPLAMHEQCPPSPSPSPSPYPSPSPSSSQEAAAYYARELSKLKVRIRSDNNFLRGWIEKRVTLDRLIRVVAYIRTTDRCEKPYPKIIQPGYIDELLADQTTDDRGVHFMYELMRRHDEANGGASISSS